MEKSGRYFGFGGNGILFDLQHQFMDDSIRSEIYQLSRANMQIDSVELLWATQANALDHA